MSATGLEVAPPVLVHAHGRDGELAARFLREAGHPCHRCLSDEELLQRLSGDVSVLLIAQECLGGGLTERLLRFVAAQPTWSDLPIYVVAASADPAVLVALGGLGNVAVLTRPMAPAMLASAVGLGIRARRRQLQVRDLLVSQQEQSARKDDFLAMLAHELRNPLAPVRYAAHLIRASDMTPGQRLKIADLVERQVAHLGRLIEQLLEVTRVMRGLIQLQRGPTDLAQLVRQSVQAHEAVAGERQVRLQCSAAQPLWVLGDATRLRQVCDNLLDNAVKFSPAGGTVSVSAQAAGPDALLRVRDEGEGIDAQDLPMIFEPFVQGDRSLERGAGGLGLGLSMVKALVQLHGGQVDARSRGKGQGSVFTVVLPLAAGTVGETAVDAAAVGTGASGDVLLVEDNLDAAEALAMLLESAGLRVTHRAAGDLGIEAARASRFDAVVCDIGLPGVDGYEVARQVRSMGHHADTLLIAVTGYGGPDARAAALAAGFDEHFTKPVAVDALLARLQQVTPSCATKGLT